MSSSPKYSDVQLVGEAKRALEKALAAAHEARAAEQRRQEALRLQRDQAELRDIVTVLRTAIGQLRAEALAANISVPLQVLQDRFESCAGSGPADKAAVHTTLKSLAGIERELAGFRRQFEAAKVGRALEGAAGELLAIRTELSLLDRRDGERFDPGQLDAIEHSIQALRRELASQRLARVEAGMGRLWKQLETHLRRVREGRETFERNRLQSQQAIAAVSDRYRSLTTAHGLTRYLQDLKHLQPDLEALASLQRGEQFDTVHHQVERLSARLDELAALAERKLEQAEKQKAVTERLVATVMSARGILLAGYPQHAEGKPAIVRFSIAGRGVLHVEIATDGPIVVRAEGFKHEHRLSPDAKVEKTCDDFVEWFEQIRNTAHKWGLEIGPLHWTGEPTPERARAVRETKLFTQTTARVRVGGTLQ